MVGFGGCRVGTGYPHFGIALRGSLILNLAGSNNSPGYVSRCDSNGGIQCFARSDQADSASSKVINSGLYLQFGALNSVANDG